jgi:hypothetical protein
MKTLPGLKIVGFVILTLTVALGVYAATKNKSDPGPRSPNVVVKFGIDGPLEKVSYKKALWLVKRVQSDPSLYRVEHYVDGDLKDHEGSLTTCSETLPTPSASHTPSPTPSTTPVATATPSASPTITPASGGHDPGTKSTNTQTQGVVAFSFGRAREFYQLLNAATEKEPGKRTRRGDR